MRCEKCGAEIEEEDVYDVQGQKLCEDCCLGEVMPQHPCDPIIQFAADTFSMAYGRTRAEDLSEPQRKIYQFIKETGKAAPEELMKEFHLSGPELRQIFIVLRWLKLAKGAREGDKIYFVPSE